VGGKTSEGEERRIAAGRDDVTRSIVRERERDRANVRLVLLKPPVPPSEFRLDVPPVQCRPRYN
jgi:hypothetical protein